MFKTFYNFYGLNEEIFLFLNKMTNIGIIPYFLKIISFCFNILNWGIIYSLYCLYFYLELKKIQNTKQRQQVFWQKYHKIVEIGITYIIFGIIFSILKYLVNLPRPFCSLSSHNFITIVDTTTQRCLSSFPSSHAGLALLVVYFFWHYMNLFSKVLIVCLVALVSLSRISLAMHYPADIVYGFIITIITIIMEKYFYSFFKDNIIYRIGDFILSKIT